MVLVSNLATWSQTLSISSIYEFPNNVKCVEVGSL